MASRLNPYLHFGGDARQALEFYQEVFGGELVLNTYGSFGQAEGGPQALAMLNGPDRFAVTISDMRMPGMDGAAYLEKAAEKDPDMVRLLLTGQSDVQAAIRAINQLAAPE